MNKNKATHSGSCQACGRVQKLPNNLLSKHGYTVEWGFFSGTCPGSHNKPFEVSCDLIKKFIADAERQKSEIEATQAKLRERVADGTTKAWFHDYKRPGWGRGNKGGYVWHEIEIELKVETHDEHTFKEYTFVNIDKEKTRLNNYISGNYDALDSVESLCTHLNNKRAAALQKNVDQLASYIKWQTERVTNWKSGKLVPVFSSQIHLAP